MTTQERNIIASETGYADAMGMDDDPKRALISRRIQSLQNSRDYADEVEAARLTVQIDRLLDYLESGE